MRRLPGADASWELRAGLLRSPLLTWEEEQQLWAQGRGERALGSELLGGEGLPVPWAVRRAPTMAHIGDQGLNLDLGLTSFPRGHRCRGHGSCGPAGRDPGAELLRTQVPSPADLRSLSLEAVPQGPSHRGPSSDVMTEPPSAGDMPACACFPAFNVRTSPPWGTLLCCVTASPSGNKSGSGVISVIG